MDVKAFGTGAMNDLPCGAQRPQELVTLPTTGRGCKALQEALGGCPPGCGDGVC